MGCDTTKPVFRVSDKAKLESVYAATEKFEASLDMLLSKKRMTKALISLSGCSGCSAPLLFTSTEDRFSHMEAHIVNNP